MGADPPKYRFGPLERRGLIAGWRGGQIASVAAGLVVGVLSLRAHPDPLGVVAAVLALASALALACWPLGGQTGEEWLPTVVRWGAGGVTGRRVRSGAPTAGYCAGADGIGPCGGAGVAGRSSGPRPFAGLRLLDADVEANGSDRVGIVHDERNGTFTGALALEGHSFALLGADEKERRVVGWSRLLAALAREGSAVHRVQWLALAMPDDGRAVHSYLEDRAVEKEDSATRTSYASLLDECGADTSRHAVLVSVQVRRPRGPVGPAVASLLREMANLRRLAADAELRCDGPLGLGALSAALRSIGQADPPAPDEEGTRTPVDARPCPPCLLGSPWPMALEVEWSRVRTDANWHATYWIAEWPRVDVGPDFLAPVLLGPLRRSVSVVMEPM
ncbi:MAG: SCO6880 family protein, partial [Acidimicrobiales bacterium]